MNPERLILHALETCIDRCPPLVEAVLWFGAGVCAVGASVMLLIAVMVNSKG